MSNELMERRAALIQQAQDIASLGVSEARQLTVEEQASFDSMIAEAGRLYQRAVTFAEEEQRSREIEEAFRAAGGRDQDNESRDSQFGQWLRSAQVGGNAFNVAPVRGAEARASRVARGLEQRAMSATGGVGADGVYGQLWEYAVASSQLLQAGVDVINTADGNALPFPVATVHPTTSDTPTSANSGLNSSDATLTTVNSTVAKYSFLTYVPTELIQDATFDVEGYVAKRAGIELGRRVAKVASAGMVAGFTVAGSTGPAGTSTSLGSQSTVGQGTDLLVDLFHSVLPEYRGNAAWVMADPSAAAIRKLKGTNGSTVWQGTLTAGDPDMILGKPVFIDPFTPSMGVSAKSIYFGDFDALKVRIAGGLRFERSAEAGFANDQVAFRGIVRCGAVALDTNAVKHFANGAS